MRKRSDETLKIVGSLLKMNTQVRFQVTGGSMSPFIRSGETVTLSPVRASHLNIGDVVFFRTKGGSALLHRIIRIKENPVHILTRGDALPWPDAPVVRDRILGKAVCIEKKDSWLGFRRIQTESRFWKAVSRMIVHRHRFRSLFTLVRNRSGRFFSRIVHPAIFRLNERS